MNPFPTLNYGNVNAEQELAQRIPQEILPQTEQLFSKILGVQQVWIVNDMASKIEAALTNNNERIEGIQASDWYKLGEALRLLLTFVNTPQESLMGDTILEVVLRRYKRE